MVRFILSIIQSCTRANTCYRTSSYFCKRLLRGTSYDFRVKVASAFQTSVFAPGETFGEDNVMYGINNKSFVAKANVSKFLLRFGSSGKRFKYLDLIFNGSPTKGRLGCGTL